MIICKSPEKEEKEEKKEEKKFLRVDGRTGGPTKGSTRGPRGPKKFVFVFVSRRYTNTYFMVSSSGFVWIYFCRARPNSYTARLFGEKEAATGFKIAQESWNLCHHSVMSILSSLPLFLSLCVSPSLFLFLCVSVCPFL